MATNDLLADGCLTINEAVKFSGIGRTMLYAQMTAGELAYTKIGARRLVPKRALIELMRKNLTGKSDPSTAEAMA